MTIQTDNDLSQPEFINKYIELVNNGSLTRSYLIARWNWMKGLGSWIELYKEYVKTKEYQIQKEEKEKLFKSRLFD